MRWVNSGSRRAVRMTVLRVNGEVRFISAKRKRRVGWKFYEILSLDLVSYMKVRKVRSNALVLTPDVGFSVETYLSSPSQKAYKESFV